MDKIEYTYYIAHNDIEDILEYINTHPNYIILIDHEYRDDDVKITISFSDYKYVRLFDMHRSRLYCYEEYSDVIPFEPIKRFFKSIFKKIK